jgi:hypothetical protein
METRSASLKSVSGKDDAGKFGNDHPSIDTWSCEATGPLDEIDPFDPPHAERAMMTRMNFVK